MKLASEIYDYQKITQYQCDIVVIAASEFALYSPASIRKNELIKTITLIKEANKEVALRIDGLVSEKDLEELKIYLQFCRVLPIDYYIFSDLSVYSYLQNFNVQAKYIYNAKTINCSANDALYYKNLGIDVIVSQELPLGDLVNIVATGNVGLEGYGHSLIFYSARKLLSSYREKYNLAESLKENIYKIKEKATNMSMYLVENKNGTFIYNENRYHIYNELAQLTKGKYFFINPVFIEEEALIKIIDIYKRALLSGVRDDDYEELLKTYHATSKGFLYQKSQILEEGQDEKN